MLTKLVGPKTKESLLSLSKIIRISRVHITIKVTCHLLRWNLECLRPHVNLLINIDTGNDKEDPGSPRPPGQQPAKPEDDSSLVFLKVMLTFY